MWVLFVALVGAILSLVAIFMVWRKFGKNIASDELPRNVQLVIQEVRAESRRELTQAKATYDAEIADIRQSHAEEITRSNKRITELEQLVAYLTAQLLVAGGKPMPVHIPQMEEKAMDIPRREMLVAVVDDPGLKMDLVIFRRAHIPFIRLRPVTLSSFEVAINRARREGKPFRHIHIAAHTSADGADFSGELATPEWLSERMRDVEILLIAGCESSEIGDWLAGIANYVVTMAEPVSAGTRPALSDIGIFAEVFWASVYDGKTAPDAFYAAIERSPTWIGEIAEIHTGIRAT